MHAENWLISTSDLISDVTTVFLDPISSMTGIQAIMQTFKAEIGIFMFAWIFRTFWPKMGVLGDKIGLGVVRCWPPMNSSYFWWLLPVPLLAKIDQEMRPWECRQTDRRTHAGTETKKIYNLSHAICYSYGADNNASLFTYNTLFGATKLDTL